MEKKKVKSKLIASGVLISFLAYTSPVLAYTKDETVYSKINSKGENYQTTVSTHLENDESEKLLEDLTNLLNIQNTNGNETFERDGNQLIWQADGKDIYYQGDSEKELPITCKIKYTLNGKEISPEELAGKSGKIGIDITYTNNEKHIIPINGIDTTLYTPFFVLTGAMINNENNKNITISNGKVINDGSKTIIVGMTMPGMQKSLGLSKDKIQLPDNVKITMESTNFELSNIITVATPKVLDEEDRKVLEDLDEIYSKVSTLQNSSNQIERGATELKKGTTTYYEKSKEFNKAMTQVQQAVNSASGQLGNLTQGIAGIGQLNNGAKQVSEGMSAVQGGLQTISNQLGNIEAGSKSIETGVQQVEKGITVAQNAAKEVTTKVLTAQETLQAAIQANNQTIANLDSTVDADKIDFIKANNVALEQSLQALETLSIDEPSSNLAILNGSIAQVKNGINGTAQNPGLAEGTKNILQGIGQLKKDGIDELISKSSALVSGTKQLYGGTQQLQEGTKILESQKVQNSLANLQTGANKLLEANNQLTEGAKKLQTGATTLAEGIQKFNTEGIRPICNYVNQDIKGLTNRAEKLLELSDNYQTFTKLKENENGNVKFIIMSDSIKVKEEKEGK